MANKWIQHIKDYAKRNNMSYGCALSSEGCKNEYNKKKVKKEQKEVKKVKKNKVIEDEEEEDEEIEEPKTTKKPISFDNKSDELQQLIYITPMDKIQKALSKLNYKGRMQTNKVMLNMQLLQNFNTIEKIQDLIDLLKEPKKKRSY